MSETTPEPIRKTREWYCAFKFNVPDTPDPAYDVAAYEALVDLMETRLHRALSLTLGPVDIETLVANEP